MNEAKPLASLSSSLLARKGDARPAMRRQNPLAGMAQPLEDLGWNDMGYDVDPARNRDPGAPAPVRSQPLAGAIPDAPVREVTAGSPVEAVMPKVVEQRSELADRLAAVPAADAPAPDSTLDLADIATPLPEDLPTVASAAPANVHAERRSAVSQGRKAAFTLRVDAERHLRLRLACAVRGRSAQQLVTEALDRLLGGMPELDTLVDNVPTRAKR